MAAIPDPAELDPVTLEIVWSRIQAVLDEAETTLMRTAFSPIIREAYDFGVVLLDATGGSVGQSQRSLPSFVGTLPRALQAALKIFPASTWKDRDVYATNDPWIGTGHLPDVTMIRPVVRHGRTIAYMGCITHWADIGGTIWSADTTEIFEEGLRLPLCKIVDGGRPNDFITSIIKANVRLPEQVMGDLHAQLATMEVGERRLQELLDELGIDDPAPVFGAMQHRCEAVMRAAIAALPDGTYTHEIELDGIDHPILLHARLTVRGDAIAVDWTGSSSQVNRGLNETYNHTYAMTVYPIKCVLSPELPNNQGSYTPITMHAREGTIINCRYPAPVPWRQIIGHCISTVILGALSRVAPDRVLADSGSPSPRIVFSGVRSDGRKYSAALLLTGGMGAQGWRDGLSAAPFPSNAGATSVEVVEANTPLLFRRRELLADSGGAGRCRGGLGVVTEVELMGEEASVVSVMVDRVNHPPLGRVGGGPGAPNVVTMDGQALHPKARVPMRPGAVLAIQSAGGGGFGPAEKRPRELVQADLDFGYVTPAAAKQLYGWTAS